MNVCSYHSWYVGHDYDTDHSTPYGTDEKGGYENPTGHRDTVRPGG